MQLTMPAQKMQKKAVLSHDMRVVELLSFIELQHQTSSANLSDICIDAGIGGVQVFG